MDHDQLSETIYHIFCNRANFTHFLPSVLFSSFANIYSLEVYGPSGPRLLAGGPLDFVLHALRALRPCDPSVVEWIVC